MKHSRVVTIHGIGEWQRRGRGREEGQDIQLKSHPLKHCALSLSGITLHSTNDEVLRFPFIEQLTVQIKIMCFIVVNLHLVIYCKR